MGGRHERRVRARRVRKGAVSVLRGVLGYVIGSVLDFLVEDACVLCGRPHRRPAGAPVDVAGPAGLLLEPVQVRWVRGRVSVTNRPVCASCARGFEVAGSVGVAGALIRPCTIVTASGERFDPADSTDGAGGCGDRPTDVGPVEKIRVVAPFMINDNVLKIIHLMKFGGYDALSRPIGRAIGHTVRRLGVVVEAPYVAVPVPMEATAKARRGFNQAERIARELGADLGIPVSADLLRKAVRTRRQSLTQREQRAANVRGAFVCRKDAGERPVGAHVFLVDDLVTTGATAASCAAALYGAGAESVTVLGFGRAL